MMSASDLLESGNTLAAGTPKEIVPGATLTLLPMEENRTGMAFDSAPAFHFILTVGGGIAVNVLSAYIYDKLKGRKGRIKMRINRRITEIDNGTITRIIEEEISVRDLP